jgi:DNA topoisomerase-1
VRLVTGGHGRGGGEALLVVESPATALTLRRWLGREWSVLATGGHLLDLPGRREGIDLAAGFEPTWELVRGKSKTLSDLKRAARRADLVLLATDPDREGEAIAWQLATELGAPGGSARVRRARLEALTPAAVARAVASPGALDRWRAEAQVARRVLDRLIGFRLSRALSAALGPGLGAGRVQAAALRLAAAWATDEVRERREAREAERGPPPPFQTTTLLAAAWRQLGFRPGKTMALAQRLYEGVRLEDGERSGLLTYPRTGSSRLGDEADGAVRALLQARHGAEAVVAGPVPGATPQPGGAHEALRPARLDLPPERIGALLRRDGERELARLHELAWERLLTSRLAPAAWQRMAPRPTPAAARRGAADGLDDATLVEALARHGVGRPSTLAGIGESLEVRGYLARTIRGLEVTPRGHQVAAWLQRTFPATLDAGFTARLEARLDAVEAGEVPWRVAVEEVWTPLERPLGRLVCLTPRVAC